MKTMRIQKKTTTRRKKNESSYEKLQANDQKT